MNIKDLIKDNIVYFSHYRAGYLYYVICANHEDGQEYQFSVPISDCGEATFNAEHKAINLMRYIRKAIENNEFIRV